MHELLISKIVQWKISGFLYGFGELGLRETSSKNAKREHILSVKSSKQRFLQINFTLYCSDIQDKQKLFEKKLLLLVIFLYFCRSNF
jgi:hypothetical protein